MDTNLLTVSQTAQYLQLSEKTIRRMIGKGSLPASKLGNRTWRIRLCDIDDYVAKTCNKIPLQQSSQIMSIGKIMCQYRIHRILYHFFQDVEEWI